MSQLIHIAVIDFGSDSILDPAVLLAPTRISLNTATIHAITTTNLGDDEYDAFTAEHPAPTPGFAHCEDKWLRNMREHLTAPWVTCYTVTPTGEADEADLDTDN